MSDAVIGALGRNPHSFQTPWVEDLDLLTSDDAQLALACCYELHYQSFQAVDDEWEWSTDLVGFRRRLEQAFLRRLVDEVGPPASLDDAGVLPALNEITTREGGVSLSRYMLEDGTLDQFREFCVHCSEYQRKEADPHTWMTPRLRGRARPHLRRVSGAAAGGDARNRQPDRDSASTAGGARRVLAISHSSR